jgi:hypothetical protein
MARARVPDEHQESVAGWSIAIVGPIAVAALLVPLRDELVSTNLALILVVVVVLAAIAGGRGPGLAAAIVAALSYDFFLTRPYLSLHIDSADDVETAVILLVIGLIVGQLVVAFRRGRGAAARGAEEVAALHRVGELVAQGTPLPELTAACEEELTSLLDLESCRYEAGTDATASADLPRLEHGGAVVGGRRRLIGRDFALPEEGVVLPVLGNGRELGRLVMFPSAMASASVEERLVAVALSDLLGAALVNATEPERGTERQTGRG